jgi:hypothetical protein
MGGRYIAGVEFGSNAPSEHVLVFVDDRQNDAGEQPRTFVHVGRVNKSANPTSRDKNLSGSVDPDEQRRR